MELRSRPFAGEADVRRLVDLVAAITAQGSRAAYWYVGDVLWALYQNVVYDPSRHVRLWEDAGGALRGFAFYHPPGRVDFQVDPRLDDAELLAEEILRWAEEYRRGFDADAEGTRTLSTEAYDDDAARLALLQRRGYTRSDFSLLDMRRDLGVPIPDVAPPPGMVVRPVAGEDEYAARVAMHREVWHPSKVTLEAYRRLRAAPGYRPELDLVAVAADGTLASYCICWLDAANRIGEFEPVGTRAAFRRRGAGKAVMLEGLRRLREHGATTAAVISLASNAASVALYESVGFRTAQRSYEWLVISG